MQGSAWSDLSCGFSSSMNEPLLQSIGVEFPPVLVSGGQNSLSGGKRKLSGGWGLLPLTSVGRTLKMVSS